MIFNLTQMDPNHIAMQRHDLRFTSNLPVERREQLHHLSKGLEWVSKEAQNDSLQRIIDLLEACYDEAREALPELFVAHGPELVMHYEIFEYPNLAERFIAMLPPHWKVHIIASPYHRQLTRT